MSLEEEVQRFQKTLTEVLFSLLNSVLNYFMTSWKISNGADKNICKVNYL